MSCENNTNRAGQAGAQNGIPTTANKSSYSIGTTVAKVGGAVAGGAVGFGVGSVVMPGLGSMALGLSGAYLVLQPHFNYDEL